MTKRITLIALVAALTMAVMAPATAAPDPQLKLETHRTAGILEGESRWLAISWSAKFGDLENFKVVASMEAKGATIAYPENTGDHASLMQDDILAVDEIDFTSFLVSVPYGTKDVKLELKASWTEDGESESEEFKVSIPVAKYSGEDVVMVTEHAGSVNKAEAGWLGVEWLGVAPHISDVHMTVNGIEGMAVEYPSEGKSTSLHFDDVLDSGENDVARFYVDATGLEPGTYKVTVDLTYTRGSTRDSLSGTIVFDVI